MPHWKQTDKQRREALIELIKYTSDKDLKEEVIGAVARGWTYSENECKEFDSELAEAIVQEVLPLITKAYEEGKKEFKKEVMQIELAPDEKTLETVGDCSGRYEAFGYGQGWIMKKIEDLP